MHQPSYSPSVLPGLTEVTKGLQIHNTNIGCTLVSKQSATQKMKKICASRSCPMTCLASVLIDITYSLQAYVWSTTLPCLSLDILCRDHQ